MNCACWLFQWNPCTVSCKTKEYFSAKSAIMTTLPSPRFFFEHFKNLACETKSWGCIFNFSINKFSNSSFDLTQVSKVVCSLNCHTFKSYWFYVSFVKDCYQFVREFLKFRCTLIAFCHIAVHCRRINLVAAKKWAEIIYSEKFSKPNCKFSSMILEAAHFFLFRTNPNTRFTP